MTERIVGFAAGNHMVSFAVAFEMLLIDIIGDYPARVLSFCHHSPYSDWGLPVETAEADRKGIYYCGGPPDEQACLQFPSVTNWRGWGIKIIEPHFGDVQHYPDAGPLRHNML